MIKMILFLLTMVSFSLSGQLDSVKNDIKPLEEKLIRIQKTYESLYGKTSGFISWKINVSKDGKVISAEKTESTLYVDRLENRMTSVILRSRFPSYKEDYSFFYEMSFVDSEVIKPIIR